MKSWAVLLVILGSSATACMSHVQLPTLRSDGPYAERANAYNQLRPVHLQYTTTIQYSRYGAVQTANTTATRLLLANGTSVYFPEDLLPAVGPNTVTSFEAREAERTTTVGNALLLSGVLASIAGAGFVTASFLSSGSSVDWPLLGVGAGLMLAGPITVTVGAVYRGNSAIHRETAFQTYDQSLRRNLGLCGTGPTDSCALVGPMAPSLTQPIPLQPTQGPMGPTLPPPPPPPSLRPSPSSESQPAPSATPQPALPPPPPPG